MILEQYYLQCLSHASYLIGDDTTGRAIVVDPRRDIGEYLTDADRLGLSIEASSTPISTPTSYPDTSNSSRRPGPGSDSAKQPKPNTRSAASHTASTYPSEQSTWRFCRHPVTRGNRSASWCVSTRIPNPPRSSPAIRCSSATSAAPTWQTSETVRQRISPMPCTARSTTPC